MDRFKLLWKLMEYVFILLLCYDYMLRTDREKVLTTQDKKSKKTNLQIYKFVQSDVQITIIKNIA